MSRRQIISEGLSDKLIWSAVNFSCAGPVTEEIRASIEEYCPVIDYSFDIDHNRSVITLLGSPSEVLEGVVAGVKTAVRLIDLTKHTGAHPRMGAADVIPFVPLGSSTMAEAVELSRKAGERLFADCGVPVYFYENSAVREEYRNLSDLRKGGFESFAAGGKTPDVGNVPVHPTAGASAVGAREPLIAYNIDFAGDDLEKAREIAKEIRHIRDAGKDFIGVKALGLYLRSRKIAQLSFNITRPDKCSMGELFHFARFRGCPIARSELIGAIRFCDLKKSLTGKADTIEEAAETAKKELYLDLN